VQVCLDGIGGEGGEVSTVREYLRVGDHRHAWVTDVQP
jgi:hypothetical protein